MFSDASVRALLLSLIAGLATLIGAAIVFLSKSTNKKTLAISLGFSSGVMLSVSFMDLIPSANDLLVKAMNHKLSVIVSVLVVATGIFLASLLDRFVPHQEFDEETGEAPHKNLYKVGFVSMLAIGLHNFPEGIATFMAGYENLSLGITIALAISLHNIPEGIVVAMPIFYATGSKKKAFKYAFLSGIAEPIGAFLAFLVLRPFINDIVLGCILALVSGIMIYVVIEELLPSSRQYGHNKTALVATFFGISIMPLTHIIL